MCRGFAKCICSVCRIQTCLNIALHPLHIHLFTVSSQGSSYPIARLLSPSPTVVGSTINPISPRNVSTWFTDWMIQLSFQSGFLPCNSWHINHPETIHHTNCENEKKERKGLSPIVPTAFPSACLLPLLDPRARQLPDILCPC